MMILTEQQRADRRKLRNAERKLKQAQARLKRAERSIHHWSRILADIRHERTRAVQPPLWPEEDPTSEAQPIGLEQATLTTPKGREDPKSGSPCSETD